jgi:LDH2 family malate/lactate/ureidoglycolate dehydrogenase
VGWAQGPDGLPTTDAELAFKTSALMPLGGEEKTSGYKGYGLALLVETFCGILAGTFSIQIYIKILLYYTDHTYTLS